MTGRELSQKLKEMKAEDMPIYECDPEFSYYFSVADVRIVGDARDSKGNLIPPGIYLF